MKNLSALDFQFYRFLKFEEELNLENFFHKLSLRGHKSAFVLALLTIGLYLITYSLIIKTERAELVLIPYILFAFIYFYQILIPLLILTSNLKYKYTSKKSIIFSEYEDEIYSTTSLIHELVNKISLICSVFGIWYVIRHYSYDFFFTSNVFLYSIITPAMIYVVVNSVQVINELFFNKMRKNYNESK